MIKTPKLLLVLGALTFLAAIAAAAFALVEQFCSNNTYSRHDWLAAFNAFSILKQGIAYSGIIIGLYGYIFVRSKMNYQKSIVISRIMYFSAIVILLLTIGESISLKYYHEAVFFKGWQTANSIAWSVFISLFFSSILFALSFIVLKKGILEIPLVGLKQNDLVCPQCQQKIDFDWAICPNCKEELFETVGYSCSKCGNDVEENWQVCPVCKEQLNEYNQENGDSA